MYDDVSYMYIDDVFFSMTCCLSMIFISSMTFCFWWYTLLNLSHCVTFIDVIFLPIYSFQRVLVTLGRHEEALVVAERGRTRAFVDFLLERQKLGNDSWYMSIDSAPVTMESILETVAKQQASVLYYSLTGEHLYTWLITPDKGTPSLHVAHHT